MKETEASPFNVGLELQAQEPIVEDQGTPEGIKIEDEIELTIEDEGNDPPQGNEEPKVEGRTMSSMLAEVYKQKGLLSDDFDVNENLSGEDLVSALESEITRKKDEEYELKYQDKYGDEDLLEYSKFLKQGGNPQSLQLHVQYDQLANADLESEENQELIYKYMMLDKGMEEDEIETMIEGFRMDDKLESKAQAAKKYFANKRDDYFEGIKNETRAREDAMRKDVENKQKEFKQIIEKSEIAGQTLSASDRKSFERDFLEPTERLIIKGEDGKNQVYKISKYQKRINEIQENPQQMVELAYFILRGLDGVKTKADEKAHSGLLKALDARSKIEVKQSDSPRPKKQEVDISKLNILYKG